jgi:hypothetical protein
MTAAPAVAEPGPAAVEPDPSQPDPVQPETLADALAAAAEAGSVAAEEFADAVAVPAEGPGSVVLDGEGRISATVFWAGSGEAVLDRVRETIGDRGSVASVSTVAPAAEVWVEPVLLDDLLALPGVSGVTPALRPASSRAALTDRLEAVRGSLPAALESRSATAETALRPSTAATASACRALPVETDVPLRSDLARTAYGVDGTGVTIGIVSDSFAHRTAPTSWDDDVAAGALPGPGNPCGRTAPVTLVSDAAGGADEGRAMAQLVHGIAPGAKILFADEGFGDFAMAENIMKLVDAGADIIVDDISWFQEPYFQQGIISAVYERARAEHGVLTIAAAGNSNATATQGPHAGTPLSSWQTSAYRPMECPAWVPIGPHDPLYGRTDIDCLDFDSGPGEQPYDLLTMAGAPGGPERVLTTAASIGEPMFGVTTDYELRFYEEDASGAPQPLDRILMFGAPYPGAVGGFEVKPGTKVRMVFIRRSFDASASAAPAVFIGFALGATAIAERQFMGDAPPASPIGDRVGAVTLGHNGDGSALSVAAVPWDAPAQLRPFSSLGPNTLLFDRVPVGDPAPAPAAPLPAPLTVSAPHVASVDGARTTFFNVPENTPDGIVYRFTGTSAAAPTVAAVAALGLSYAPEATADELRAALAETARGASIGGPVNPYDPALFPDAHVFGSGLVDANALLAALPAPNPPGPGPGPGPDPVPVPDPDDSDARRGSGDPVDLTNASGSPTGRLSATGGTETPFGALGAGLLALGAAALVAAARSRRTRGRGHRSATG